jgi:hypothetical protein
MMSIDTAQTVRNLGTRMKELVIFILLSQRGKNASYPLDINMDLDSP